MDAVLCIFGNSAAEDDRLIRTAAQRKLGAHLLPTRATTSAFVYLAFIAAALGSSAYADERMFNYVSTTDSLPQDKWELENQIGARLEKSRGDYQLYQLTNGVEYGVTSDFQAGLFLKSHHVTADQNSPQGRTSGPYVPQNATPDRRYSAIQFETVSLAAKYRLLSPYIDDFGIAALVVPAVGPRENTLAYGLIGQKNFMDDTLVVAANLVARHAWLRRTSSTTDVYDPAAPGDSAGWNRKSYVDFTMGLSTRFTENWFAGLEFRNSNQFSGCWFGDAGHSAFFLGPNLHYGGEKFWATLSVIPQLPIAKAYSSDQRRVMADGRLYGDEHEQLEIRLAFGIPL
jgi:hypothetical protein